MESPPSHGPKARWGLTDVADVAVGLADVGGLDGVSLAKVAARLGMTTTALYRYVDSKDVLVELMIDHGVGPPPCLDGESWQQRCRAWLWALRERYEAHPWLVQVQPRGMPRQPNVFGWIEALVLAVEGVGVDGMRLALLLEGLVRTFSGIARGVADSAEPDTWLTQALGARFPRLSSLVDRDWSDANAELEFAANVVLAGVRANEVVAETGDRDDLQRVSSPEAGR